MNLKLRIEDMADTGQGIARVDGLVHFVSAGLPGDVVLAKRIEKKRNYCVCEALELLEPSELRTEEHKELFFPPFGLDLMPLDEAAELGLKEAKVRMELTKALGNLDELRFNPIIGMSQRMRYRNKAVFPFRFVRERNICGAFERLSHFIVEDVDNPSMPESFASINAVLLDWLNQAGLKCYDEAAHRGTLRYVTIRSNEEGEHLILLTVKEDVLPSVSHLIKLLEAKEIKIKGILKTVKEERGNTPYGSGVELLYGEERLEDRVGDVRFSLSVNSFFQVSREGCEKLYDEVYRLADLDRVADLWDVYCGVGSIGLYLLAKHRSASAGPPSFTSPDSGTVSSAIDSQPAPFCSSGNTAVSIVGPVTLTESSKTTAITVPVPAAPGADSPIELWGLEAVEEAVKDAALNAQLNGIENAQFEYGLAEKALARRFKSHKAPDLLIVDPPRKGLERSAVDAIIKAAPERIIYVSCKVSTLARDLKLFTEAGYKLIEVTPVNLFPMTMHVETVCLLSRKDVLGDQCF